MIVIRKISEIYYDTIADHNEKKNSNYPDVADHRVFAMLLISLMFQLTFRA